MDYEDAGFMWLDCSNESRCLYSIMRSDGKQRLIAVFNMSDKTQSDYRIMIPSLKKIETLLYSDWQEFGGQTERGKEFVKQGKDELIVTLEAYSGILLKEGQEQLQQHLLS